jgi:lysophospholipase L1-like esterase
MRQLALCLSFPLVLAAAPIVLDDCENVGNWRVTRKPATVVAADSAAKGKGAIQVTMPGMVTRSLSRTYVPGSAVWDTYAGVSFWVKGDGSDQFGCLAVQGRYPFVTYFPLKNTEWHQLVVPWRDFVPESQAEPIGGFGAMPPSGINTLRLGTRWTIHHNNEKIPAHSYSIDQIELVEEAPAAKPVPQPRPFQEILDLLKAGKPVRIQCMGDSITAGTGLADRDAERYATQTQNLLRKWLKNDQITCYSRAVGGAKLTDARAWIPRDFVGPIPDLVTMWYGYNDKSGAYTREFFERSLNDYIDRILVATEGKAAILLFATGPGCGPRFTMLDDYAETVRQTAKRRGLPCFDINANLKTIGREHMPEFFGDMAHPNVRGHKRIADWLSTYLVEAAGITTPKPQPPPRPIAETGISWDFEDGAKEWNLDCDEVTCPANLAVSGTHSLRFALPEAGKDHRRAYSPVLPVRPRELYQATAQIQAVKPLSKGSMGFYVCLYSTPDGKGDPKIVPIQRGLGAPGKWIEKTNRLEIPEGMQSLRVMIWASRDAVGEFRCDDVVLEPLKE